jgi:hypothetical protein
VSRDPAYFISDPTVNGLPRLIYVSDPDPPLFLQTQLSAVWCKDETGGDALGDDELYVWFGGMNTVPHFDDIADLEGQFDVWSGELDSSDHHGKARHLKKLVSSVQIGRGSNEQTELLVYVGEDDDFGPLHVLAGAIGAVAGAYTGAQAGSALGPPGAALGAISGGIAGAVGALAAAKALLPNPDDLIGQTAWQANLSIIQANGLLAHDSLIGSGKDPSELPALTGVGFDRALRSRIAGKHPGVDLTSYTENSEIKSCASSSTCTGGRTCVLGACVTAGWEDPTLPLGTFDPQKDVAGTVESIHFKGDGEYVIYVSSSVSDETGK